MREAGPEGGKDSPSLQPEPALASWTFRRCCLFCRFCPAVLTFSPHCCVPRITMLLAGFRLAPNCPHSAVLVYLGRQRA